MPNNTADVNYGWYTWGTGNPSTARLYIYESGVNIANYPYNVGDQVSLERVGAEMRYFINGTLVRTTPAVSTELFATQMVHNNGTESYPMEVSFCSGSPIVLGGESETASEVMGVQTTRPDAEDLKTDDPEAQTESFTSLAVEPLMLFPNPTLDKVTVRFAHPDLNGAVQLRLTDNLGRTLHEAKYEAQGRFEAQLNLSHLPTGTYLLHVVSEQTTGIQKVIKR